MRRALVLPLFLLAGCLGLGCPCGSDRSDPLREHDPTYAGLHVIDGECNCRCGDDPPVAFTRDRDCGDYEGACVDASGEPAEQLCQ